jgi:nuclease S1
MKKRLMPLAPFLLAACLTTLLPARAAAWGGEGHRITARVAWARMKPETRAAVLKILDGFGSLEHASTWPDTLYGNPAKYGHTFRWHYVDIPTESDHRYSPDRDCAQTAGGDCAVNAIARERLVLADDSTPAFKRRAALRFVIHFVGDLHQPLHCAEDNNDEGGNLKPVCFMGKCWESSGKNYNLHRTWDKLMILHTGLTETRYVEKILERVAAMTGDEVAAVIAGDPVAWAEDAHRVAYERAYKLPATKKNKKNPKKNKVYTYHILGPKYHKDNIGFVEDQLLRGGLRLAAVLDEALQ